MWSDLWRHPGAVVVVSWRVLTAADALSPLEEQQVVEALHASAWTEITSAEEAFDVVDGGEINQVELWDASNRQAFTAYEFGAGDNSFGLIFSWGTVTAAARINDGDLYDCSVFWGAERRPCAGNDECAGDLVCQGFVEEAGQGMCLDPGAVEHPAAGAECSEQIPCPPGSGLVCAAGVCNPAWMRGRFVAYPETEIPDNDGNGITVSVPVFGLATVSTEVEMDLYIVHPRPADIRVTLVNPSGTVAVVFDQVPGGSEIFLRGRPVLFPGDESANGIWEVRVTDTAPGQTGTLVEVALTVTSRMD